MCKMVRFIFKVYLVFSFLLGTAFPTPSEYKVISDEANEPYKPMVEPHIDAEETEAQYWRDKGSGYLQAKLKQTLNTNVAKNIIFFMGDGMSIPTVTAARIYRGQLNKHNGEEEELFFETFPYTGLSKTYCVDKQVSDSASTATAYMAGVKGNYMTVGLTAKVKPADCESAKVESNRPSSIVKWAQEAGKATGVVTNTRITHASPAGCYAHVPYRYMESDDDVRAYGLDANSCNFDVAKQLIYDDPGKNIKVIMGGGRDKFLSQNGSVHGQGKRMDKDLVEEWKKDKIQRQANAAYVTTAQELEKVDIKNTDFLLGLFAADHMEYHTNKPDNEPSLSQMTETAIKILQKEDKGFFLFVEGGKIDIAHHETQARRALDETLEFDKAIQIAAKLTDEKDTLIVVTADHAHTMSISGYPQRGFDILGIYGKSKDGKPYATLSYANGPGYQKEITPGVAHDLREDDMNAATYAFPALVSRGSETHGGDDVAVFARGPWAHLFTGNFEQSYIPIAEAYAANIPVPFEVSPSSNHPNASIKNSANYIILMSCVFALFWKYINI